MNEQPEQADRSASDPVDRRQFAAGSSLLLLALGAALLLWTPGLATGSIVNGDDALYAGVLRQLARGADYFRVAAWRPPLFYGLGVASVKAFGVTELALRLPSVISGLALVAATFAAARALFPTRIAVAFGAALLVATSGQVFMFARNVRGLDLLLTALLTGAIAAAASAGTARARWAGVGVLLGLAFATKSVVVVVALPAVALLWWRSHAERRSTAMSASIAGLATASLWPLWVLMSGAHGAVRDHVGQHVVRRATDRTMVAAPESSPLYYLETLVQLEGWFGIAASAAIAGLVVLAFRRVSGARTLLVWIAGVLLPFSLVATRLPHYMLPAYPALAVAVSLMVCLVAERLGARRWAPALVSAVATLFLFTSPIGIAPGWGNTDFSPHLRAGALRARAILGEQGELAVWNEYHVAAAFYFDGPTMLWTDNEGFLEAYGSTHGFREGVHYRRVASADVAAALLNARPACLLVRDDRSGSVAPLLDKSVVSAERVDGATLYCAP